MILVDNLNNFFFHFGMVIELNEGISELKYA